MRLIGDVHGHYRQYKKIIKNVPASIQVGDMGVGFRHIDGVRAGEFTQNPPHAAMAKGKHLFIRGNHDNPAECRKHSQWIPDGLIDAGVMFIGGAPSIDWQFRKEGYSWWRDEELSKEELDRLIKVYKETKPKVMITHTCPTEIANAVMVHHRQDRIGEICRTEIAFQEMFAVHQPELWVFGHWHNSIDYQCNDTRFVCLAELEFRDDLIV